MLSLLPCDPSFRSWKYFQIFYQIWIWAWKKMMHDIIVYAFVFRFIYKSGTPTNDMSSCQHAFFWTTKVDWKSVFWKQPQSVDRCESPQVDSNRLRPFSLLVIWKWLHTLSENRLSINFSRSRKSKFLALKWYTVIASIV